jgi:hypothetical protein
MSTPRAPMSGAPRGLEVTSPVERKSMASSSEWMPRRSMSSAVSVLEVAGAAAPVSADLEAVVTTV